MPRIAPVDPNTAEPDANPLLDAVQRALGTTPNMMRTMARSPAVLDAYLAMSGALAKGRLGAKLGEQIALVTAQENGCDYCAAAHTYLATALGCTPADADAARAGHAGDPKSSAALHFARTVLATRGHVRDEDLDAVRRAGLTDGEVGEVIAHVALNVFTNYFNSTAQTEVDFPAVRPTGHPQNAAAV